MIRLSRRCREARRSWTGAAGALLVLSATACTPVLPGAGEPPELYSLTPKSTFSADLPRARWQLIVEIPFTVESLNTSRIAVRRTPLSLQYYKNVRWTERAPVMVQTLLVESFENTGKIVAVARQATDLRADYVLKSDLREFQAEYGDQGPPTIRARLNAKMVKMPERTIVASHTTEHRTEARGSEIGDIVLAFDVALGKSLKSIVEWALRVP